MGEDSLDVVRRMWIAYREGGAEAGLPLLAPDVEFVTVDGRCWRGRDGVRAFFRGFEERGERFQASAFTFEPVGELVLVVGHQRVQRSDGVVGDYLFFLHRVSGGVITRVVAHPTRAAAEREVAQSARGPAEPPPEG